MIYYLSAGIFPCPQKRSFSCTSRAGSGAARIPPRIKPAAFH